MNYEFIKIPPFGFLPGGEVKLAVKVDDLSYWYLIQLSGHSFNISEQSYGLYIALCNRKRLNYRAFRVLVIESDIFWEMVPVWQLGILRRFNKRKLPKSFIKQLLAKQE